MKFFTLPHVLSVATSECTIFSQGYKSVDLCDICHSLQTQLSFHLSWSQLLLDDDFFSCMSKHVIPCFCLPASLYVFFFFLPKKLQQEITPVYLYTDLLVN